jgi:hypothetical protein
MIGATAGVTEGSPNKSCEPTAAPLHARIVAGSLMVGFDISDLGRAAAAPLWRWAAGIRL